MNLFLKFKNGWSLQIIDIPRSTGTGVHAAAAICQGTEDPKVYIISVPIDMIGTVKPDIQPRFLAFIHNIRISNVHIINTLIIKY